MRTRSLPWILLLLPLGLPAQPSLPMGKPVLKTPVTSLPGSTAQKKKKSPEKASPKLQEAIGDAANGPGGKALPGARLPASTQPGSVPFRPAAPVVKPGIPALPGSSVPSIGSRGPSRSTAFPAGGRQVIPPAGRAAPAGGGFAPAPASGGSALSRPAGRPAATGGFAGKKPAVKPDTKGGFVAKGPDAKPESKKDFVVDKPATDKSASAVRTGAPASAGRSNQPEHDEEAGAYVWGDGTRTPDASRNGTPAKVNEKGDVSYDDGTTVVNNGQRGVTVHHPDGTSDSYEADQNGAWQPAGTSNQPQFDEESGSYGWSDGSRIRAFGPDGSLGKINEKGDIMYGDGSIAVNDGKGGVTVTRSDGSYRSYRQNGDGSWSTEGKGGGKDSGGGSDQGRPSGGGKPGSSSGKPGGKTGGKQSSSKPSGDSGKGKTSGKDSGSKESKDTSDEGSSADAETNAGGKEGKETKETGKEGGDKRDYGSGSYADGPSALVQGIVARARGEQRDPESSQPEECPPEGRGGGVTQPGAGGQENCVPAGTPGVATDDSSTPDAGESATATDRRGRARVPLGSQVSQPGLGDDKLRGGDLRPLDPFDRNPVTNPGEPR